MHCTCGSRLSLFAATVIVVLCGCKKAGDSQPMVAQPPPKSLRLVVVDDPALARQIGRFKGEWNAGSGAELEIREDNTAAIAAAKTLSADAIIYPPSELGSLAERRLIRSLPADWLNRPELHKSDLFDPGALAECQWGEQTFAVPFGSPVFVLMYRRDLFERYHLEPPRDWAEYQRVVVKLDEHVPELTGLQATAIEPLAPGWAGKTLLARAAAYARHRDYYATLFDKETMAPQIDSLAFVRALDELVAAMKTGATASLAAAPADARDAVLSGRAAIAITWPTAARKPSIDSPPSAVDERADSKSGPLSIGFIELPGASQSYNPKTKSWEAVRASEDAASSRNGEGQLHDSGSTEPSASPPRQSIPLVSISGRVGSVTTGSPSPESAFRLLCWLSGDPWSSEICPASPSTTLFRRSHLEKPSRWVEAEIPSDSAKKYVQVVATSMSRPQWIICLRIPGNSEYMATLDEAVRAAVEGKQSAAEALSAAAKHWQETTKKIGVDSQHSAYIRSLGLEP